MLTIFVSCPGVFLADLYGDEGNDIVLGDVGYILRRYSGSVPLLTSSGVWHKDVVLEELGEITVIERISQKVNVSALPAESIAAASLLFVANAYQDNGAKYLEQSNTWLTDLITFDLEPSHDDYLHGGPGDDGECDRSEPYALLPKQVHSTNTIAFSYPSANWPKRRRPHFHRQGQ